MQAELILRQLLTSSTALTAIVGSRIVSDRAEQEWQKPFIMFSRSGTTYEKDLDNNILARLAQIEIQIWADTRSQSANIAQIIEGIFVSTIHDVADRNDLYNEELDEHGESVTVGIYEF